jgi:hypothetical protein
MNASQRPVNKRRKPIFGITALILSLAVILLPSLFGFYEGGQIDLFYRSIAPVVIVSTAIMAFILRERPIWPTLSIIFVGFYIAMHCVPSG